MQVTKKSFGRVETGPEAGKEVEIYTLSNGKGMAANIITYGATIQSLSLNSKDVALGYDNLKGYLENDGCLGATIGRVANRIKDGKFSLNGEDFQLALNNGTNTLHGGNIGFHQRVFTPTVDSKGLHLTYLSPAGEEGFPGEVVFIVTYCIDDENKLNITYNATSTAETPFQVTNHSYFNLDLPEITAAHSKAAEKTEKAELNVGNHALQIEADAYDKNDETGVAQPSKRTTLDDDAIFDFRSLKKIGQDIQEESQQLDWAKGYDHAFVLRKKSNSLAGNNSVDGTEEAATLTNGKLTLKVFTTLGYLHVYTGNYLDMRGKAGVYYGENAGVALEAEHEPNAINAEDIATREKAILTPSKPLNETISFQLLENFPEN